MLLRITYMFRCLWPILCLWTTMGALRAQGKVDDAWERRYVDLYRYDHKGNEDTLVTYAWKAFYLAREHKDLPRQLAALSRFVNTTKVDSLKRYLAIVDTFPESVNKVKIYGTLEIRYYDRLVDTLEPKEVHLLTEDIIHKADSVYADSLDLDDEDAETMYIFKNRRYLVTLVNHVRIDSKKSPFYPYIKRLNRVVGRLPAREYATKFNTYLTTSGLAINMKDYEQGLAISEQLIQGIIEAPHTGKTFQDMNMANASICYYMCYQQLECYDYISEEMLARNWKFMDSPYGHKCLEYLKRFFLSKKLTPELYYFMAKGEVKKVINLTEEYIEEYKEDIDTRQRFVDLQDLAIEKCLQPSIHVKKLHRNFTYTNDYHVHFYQGKQVDYANLFEIKKLKLRIEADKLENNKSAVFWSKLQLGSVVCIGMLGLVGLIALYVTNVRKRKLIDHLREETVETVEERHRTEEAKMMQTISLDNMNHEIRSPLNSIVGFTELLIDNPDFDREMKQEFSTQISTSSSILLQIINDVLDAAQLEAGQYTLQNKYWAVQELCSYAIRSMESRLLPGVELSLENQLGEEIVMYVDKVRLLQILLNFLSNACKHTFEGSVTLACIWADNEHTRIIFRVSDTGNGIPKEKQSLLFQRFEKFNNKIQGTGLGLNIAATLSDLMGGEIGYDTTYTDGARFYLILPKDGK